MGPPKLQFRVNWAEEAPAVAAPGVKGLECAEAVESAALTYCILAAAAAVGRAVGFSE